MDADGRGFDDIFQPVDTLRERTVSDQQELILYPNSETQNRNNVWKDVRGINHPIFFAINMIYYSTLLPRILPFGQIEGYTDPDSNQLLLVGFPHAISEDEEGNEVSHIRTLKLMADEYISQARFPKGKMMATMGEYTTWPPNKTRPPSLAPPSSVALHTLGRNCIFALAPKEQVADQLLICPSPNDTL